MKTTELFIDHVQVYAVCQGTKFDIRIHREEAIRLLQESFLHELPFEIFCLEVPRQLSAPDEVWEEVTFDDIFSDGHLIDLPENWVTFEILTSPHPTIDGYDKLPECIDDAEHEEADDRIFSADDLAMFGIKCIQFKKAHMDLTERQLTAVFTAMAALEEGDGSYEEYEMPKQKPLMQLLKGLLLEAPSARGKSNGDKTFYWAPWHYDDPDKVNVVISNELMDQVHGHSIYERLPDGTDRCLIDAAKEDCEHGCDRLNEREINLPNGFNNYLETFYEVVSYLNSTEDTEGTMAYDTHEQVGRGGMYELAENLTSKFETQYKDREWDGEFFDTIEAFLRIEDKQRRD